MVPKVAKVLKVPSGTLGTMGTLGTLGVPLFWRAGWRHHKITVVDRSNSG